MTGANPAVNRTGKKLCFLPVRLLSSLPTFAVSYTHGEL